MLLVHALVLMVKKKLAKDEQKRLRVSWQFIGSMFFWVKTLFMTVLQLVFDVFMCDEHRSNLGPNNTVIEGTTTTELRLRADPEVTCDGDSGWYALVGTAAFMLCLLVVAFPLYSVRPNSCQAFVS